MDRRYIENEHIVDRYLAGELTVKEAREFEKYCRDHPDVLAKMPIPVRLKARLSRHPSDESETGVFKTIPSSATHAALAAVDDGFDVEDEREVQSRYGGVGVSRVVVIGLGVALLGALGGLVVYAMEASSLSKQLQTTQRDMRAVQMQAYSDVQVYRVRPVSAKPDQPTLAVGWQSPPQLIDLYIDASQGKYTQFRITIDKADGTRALMIHRMARDSNKELRVGLNSSAFGPGDYLVRVEGYTWRGQAEEIGWIGLGLQ